MEFGEGVRVGSGITMGGIGVNRRPMPTPRFDLTNLPPIITDSSLVLHLDAGDENSYSGSGLVWNDISGNGFQATMTSDMASNYVRATAPFGYPNRLGSYFDLGIENSARYAQIPYNATLRPTEGITMEVFAYENFWTSGFGSYVLLPSGQFFGYDGGSSFRFQVNNTTTDAGFPFINQLGKWFHLVGTYDRSRIRTYLNTVEGTSIALTSAISYGSTYSTWINGTNNASPASAPVQNFIRGWIAIIRVYNRALTAAEIKNNYDAQKFRFGIT
jgi:hypothetical protein